MIATCHECKAPVGVVWVPKRGQLFAVDDGGHPHICLLGGEAIPTRGEITQWTEADA